MQKLNDWKDKMIPFLDNITNKKLPSDRLGCHWIVDQYRQSDLQYMQALRPAVIKIVNPSPDRVLEAMNRIDSNGHVALRFHPISEQQNELRSDPVGTAKRHAAYWINQITNNYKNFELSKLYVMGINEPTIHTAEDEIRVARYTEVFLEELLPHQIRSYVFNFSVGWPREVNGRIIWDNFLFLESLINESNSFGCVHEYWFPNVKSGWGSYGNRISRCPMKIPFIIGECGYTRQLAQLIQPWGWDGNISAETYADMLWEYANTVDPSKVFAVLPFTTSFGGEEWRSKDTAKAHKAIVARKKAYNWPIPFPMYKGELPVLNSNLLIYPKWTNHITGFFGSLYTSKVGAKYAHDGLDISMTIGTPVYSPYAGIVSWAGEDSAGYGKYIRISTVLHVDFFFGHLSEQVVKTGDVVTQGQLIGKSGNTGNSSGPHEHFEIRMKALDNVTYKSDASAFANGRIDPIAFAVGWVAMGGRVEER